MEKIATFLIVATCLVAGAPPYHDCNALHRIKRTSASDALGNVTTAQDFLPLYDSVVNAPNPKKITEADTKLDNIIADKAKKETKSPALAHENNELDEKSHAGKDASITDLDLGNIREGISDRFMNERTKLHNIIAARSHAAKKSSASQDGPLDKGSKEDNLCGEKLHAQKDAAIIDKNIKDRNAFANLLDTKENGGKRLSADVVTNLHHGNIGDGTNDGFMYERTLQLPIFGENYRDLPNLASQNFLRDTKKDTAKYNKLLDEIYTFKTKTDKMAKKRDGVSGHGVGDYLGYVKNMQNKHPLKRQRDPQIHLQKFTPLLKFANMMLYNVDSSQLREHGLDMLSAANPLTNANYALDNDEIDSADFIYSSPEIMAPPARSVLAPQSNGAQPICKLPHLIKTEHDSQGKDLFNLLKSALNTVLINSDGETNDDGVEWYCPVHRGIKKTDELERGCGSNQNEGADNPDGIIEDENDEDNMENKNDVIQLCSCHFIKKKKNI